MRTITTIRDAEQLVSDWTDNYVEPPTDEQVRRAARALVDYLGGYGADADALTCAVHGDDCRGCVAQERVTAGFDLDAALEDRRDPAAVALGRRTSPAKARAARANGAKGGRPRKRPAEE